ncbi:MAG TPA: RNB domain-containing ribonuclease, partial [Actinomycetota bacterium]|nr:RNB domain-containing ribonuclease [Actinomycetota bacterium]
RVAQRPVAPGAHRADRRNLELVTIDPPGSMDLDQAFCAAPLGSGYRVYYAIADVGFFVEPESALEAESMVRGSTLYSPDLRIPLYPPVLSEGAASLLPEQDRPAVLWTFDLSSDGNVDSVSVGRAVVRSRRRLTYLQAQEEIDSPNPVEPLRVLKAVGLLRQEVERARGGVDLRIQDQQIEKTSDGYEVAYRSDYPVERWNAQISLMTGIAAARLMLQRGTGLLRTLPAPSEETIEGLRASAAALGLEWAHHVPYQDFIRSLDGSRPKGAAMLSAARVLFRGAGYAFFHGAPPEQPSHYAVAAPYAHVTAPLRRMADRLCNELLVSAPGADPPAWLLDRLAEAPEVLKSADKRSRELDSRLVDFVEAQTLSNRLGEVFTGVVVETGSKGALIQLSSPAVLATSKGSGYRLGEQVFVRLTVADPVEGDVRFEPA